MTWIERIIFFSVFSLIALLIYIVYLETTSPVISIKRDDWNCVKEEMNSSLQPTMVGNNMVMLPVFTKDCVEYKKK